MTVGAPRPDLTEPFEIGGIRIANRVLLAPLAGIGNWFVRLQAKRHGAGLAVSEMVSSFALHYRNERTLRDLMRIHPDEHPVSVQLFGHDAEVMRSGAEIAARAGADLIDINMGCPVPKICKTGAGAALLADPEAAARIVEAMVRAVDVPVTVKMRRGLTPRTSDPTETARRFEAAGAAAICLHPRAAAEEYSGAADHRITAEVVAAVGVPVVASGDIATPEQARRVLEDTGCAAIAVGRAALGNPWVYGEILRGAAEPRPSLDAVIDEIALFATDAALAIGESRAVGYLRKFYPWYLAGYDIPHAELAQLLTAPSSEAALARLRSLAAASAAA